MRGPNSISSPGITTKADSSANRMDLIRHRAMSGPSLNCSMATRPPMVVRLLAPISGMDLLRDTITASRSASRRCSSLKRLQKMMA